MGVKKFNLRTTQVTKRGRLAWSSH